MYRLLKGVTIFIYTDMNLNNEFIPGYSKKKDILDPGGPRKSDVFFVFGKTIGKQYENFECFLPGVGYYLW